METSMSQSMTSSQLQPQLNGQTPPSPNGYQNQPPSLYSVLKAADLLQYLDKMRTVLKLRHAGDLAYAEEKDLSSIGMSRPEQKRLRREQQRLLPHSSLRVRLRKVFGRHSTEPTTSAATPTATVDDMDGHLIAAESVELCRELGRGEFGVCFQGQWSLPHGGETMQVAIKRVPPEKLKSDPAAFLQEAAVMTRMRHEHVIRLYGVVIDAKSVMLVSELAAYGSLLECLRQPAWAEPIAVDTLCDFARQIAEGMSYLAAQRLIHRDLAARNVLIAAMKKVKISDFGLSRSLGIGEDYYRSDFSPAMRLPIAWCAPECINLLRFTSASDVYAYGVTLWEMFAYGRMPWQGFTGPQILHAIDTQRQCLERPDACPDGFFALMRRCWSHEADQRPSFEEIAQTIPEIMPQLLVAVLESKSGEGGQLEFEKGEIVILLDKCQTSATDETVASFWHGALRNGQIGLFRPADTVTYLGAENPTAQRPILIPTTNGKSKESRRSLKLEKDRIKVEKAEKEKIDRERRKLLISEPQGDLRHTCHVGLDGKVFGLIHVSFRGDTKSPESKVGKPDLSNATGADVARTLPPLIGLSDPAALNVASISPHSTGSAQSIGSRTAIVAPTIGSVRAMGRDDPMSCSMTSDCSDLPQRMPKGVGEDLPPALPPKPAARIRPQQQKSLPHNATLFVETPKSVAHRTQSLPRTNGIQSNGFSGSSSGGLSETLPFIRPVSGLDSNATTDPACSSPTRLQPNSTSVSLRDSSQLLDDVLNHLQRDISDFSVSTTTTINDYSDTRPLLPPREPRAPRSAPEAVVRPLTDPEAQRLQRRIDDEHRRAAQQLAKEFRRFQRMASKQSANSDEEPQPGGDEEPPEVGTYTAKLWNSSKQQSEEWSDEAQEAYKLLVECGDLLKATSPRPERPANSPLSSTGSESTIRRQKCSASPPPPPLPPKRIEYINPTLVGADEPVERPQVVEQRNRMAMDSRKAWNQSADGERPPLIPPKPKARQTLSDSPRGFAPPRSALFAGFPKDEVVKF